jgi:hypothetical protein
VILNGLFPLISYILFGLFQAGILAKLQVFLEQWIMNQAQIFLPPEKQ